jgi:hypothetical protein
VDPKNWTVFDQQHTVQKGESTNVKTSNFQTGIQGPRRPPGSDRSEDRGPLLNATATNATEMLEWLRQKPGEICGICNGGSLSIEVQINKFTIATYDVATKEINIEAT